MGDGGLSDEYIDLIILAKAINNLFYYCIAN